MDQDGREQIPDPIEAGLVRRAGTRAALYYSRATLRTPDGGRRELRVKIGPADRMTADVARTAHRKIRQLAAAGIDPRIDRSWEPQVSAATRPVELAESLTLDRADPAPTPVALFT